MFGPTLLANPPKPRLSKRKNGGLEALKEGLERGKKLPPRFLHFGPDRKNSGIHSPIREASGRIGRRACSRSNILGDCQAPVGVVGGRSRRSRCHRYCHISATSIVGRRIDPPPRTSCSAARSACGTSQGEGEDLQTNGQGRAVFVGMDVREANGVARRSGVWTFEVGGPAHQIATDFGVQGQCIPHRMMRTSRHWSHVHFIAAHTVSLDCCPAPRGWPRANLDRLCFTAR